MVLNFVIFIVGLIALCEAIWIVHDRHNETDIVLRLPNDALYQRARGLVAHLETEQQNPQWKWHQAYGTLVSEFPDRPRRDVTLAIDAAHRTL